MTHGLESWVKLNSTHWMLTNMLQTKIKLQLRFGLRSRTELLCSRENMIHVYNNDRACMGTYNTEHGFLLRM